MTTLNDLRRTLRTEYGSGNYRIGKDGTVRVRAAGEPYWRRIGTAGKGKFRHARRPADLANGRKVTLYLDDIALARANRMGNGNISLGVRRALELTDA